MAGNRITIQFEGDPTEGGHVRLSILIKKLDALKKALNKTEKLITNDDKPTITYRVVGMSHNSPLQCTLEAVTPARKKKSGQKEKKQRDYSTANISRFVRNLNAIKKRKNVFDVLDTETLEAYQILTNEENGLVKNIKIVNGKQTIDVDSQFQRNLTEILGQEEKVYSSLTGRIEWLNVHGENKFYIYPTDGTSRILGEFQDDLKKLVYDSIEKYVRVHGLVSYKYNEHCPYKIHVDGLEILKDESLLAPINTLQGSIRKDAFIIPSDEFVKGERSVNW